MGSTYQTGNEDMVDGTTPWAAAQDHRMALLVAAYTPDPDDDDLADLTAAEELSGASYGRVAIDGQAVVVDDANNQIELDCSDVTFASLSSTAGSPTQALTYLHNAADSLAILHVCNDLTTPPTPNGGDYIIQPSAEGLIKIAS